jgi:radical SAM superfamily enzyme YgiQ (UPF0313 family)
MAASANVILRKTDIDLCVVGDGEIAWLKLIEHYRKYGRTRNQSLEKIAGVSFIDENSNICLAFLLTLSISSCIGFKDSNPRLATAFATRADCELLIFT